MATKTDSLVNAVMNEDVSRVEALIAQGAPLEESDHRGQTPLVIAAVSDQFEIAERLLQAGADPFAVDKFGWTAGYAIQTSKLQRGPEFDAMQRVSVQLIERGYPVPGPDKPEIKRMVAEGNWPPVEWRQ